IGTVVVEVTMKEVNTQGKRPSAPKLATIRGSEVPTTVWSMAAVNRPSRVPAITTTLVRVLNWEMDWTPAGMEAATATPQPAISLPPPAPQGRKRSHPAPGPAAPYPHPCGRGPPAPTLPLCVRHSRSGGAGPGAGPRGQTRAGPAPGQPAGRRCGGGGTGARGVRPPPRV